MQRVASLILASCLAFALPAALQAQTTGAKTSR